MLQPGERSLRQRAEEVLAGLYFGRWGGSAAGEAGAKGGALSGVEVLRSSRGSASGVAVHTAPPPDFGAGAVPQGAPLEPPAGEGPWPCGAGEHGAVIFAGALVPNSELMAAAQLAVDMPSRQPLAQANEAIGCFAAGNVAGAIKPGQWCEYDGMRVGGLVKWYLSK